jgi:Lrp/AsnC family leucine-responsive transcriptional regulator
VELDGIDKSLLRILQQDSKRTNKELAVKLGMSVTAIYERIKKLERLGVIKNYVALLDDRVVGRGFVVFCHIKLLRHAQEAIADFERQVRKLSEVNECYHVSGDYDYLLKVRVRDMEDFRRFMVEKLTTLDHIGSTQSSFSISEVKNSTALSI